MPVPAPKTSPPPSLLLREDKAAEILGFSVRTLQNWRLRGIGPPFVAASRSVRYLRSDLEAWVIKQRRLSTSDQGLGAESKFRVPRGPRSQKAAAGDDVSSDHDRSDQT